MRFGGKSHGRQTNRLLPTAFSPVAVNGLFNYLVLAIARAGSDFHGQEGGRGKTDANWECSLDHFHWDNR